MSSAAAAALAVALLIASARPAAAGSAIMRDDLDQAVAAFPGAAGVVVDDPATGYRYARNEDMEFVTASLYKLGVMVEAYRQAAAGTLSLDDTIEVTPDDIPWSDGWITPAGTELSVRDALEMAIAWSDNSAALALLRTVDVHNVNATFASLGMTRTKIEFVLPDEERDRDDNVTTPRDMDTLFMRLLAGTVVSPAASAKMLELLSRQHVDDRLPAGLPAGTRIAHKTGNYGEYAHDAGVIYAPQGPRVIVMLTAWAGYDEVVTLAARIAAAAYDDDEERFAAAIVPGTLPTLARTTGPLTLRVKNLSSFAWSDEDVVVTWTGAAGTFGWTAALLPKLDPGEESDVELAIDSPPPGTYLIQAKVVRELTREATAPLGVVVEVR